MMERGSWTEAVTIVRAAQISIMDGKNIRGLT